MKKKIRTETKTAKDQKPTSKDPEPQPVRHPDADFVQKTHFGYIGAYA